MDETTRKIVLLLVIIGIVGTIILLESLKATPLPTNGPVRTIADPSNTTGPGAPELAGIEGYVNVPEGFTLSSVKGKVILIDFWTYSCINCIRTQPYLNAWHQKYQDEGLVIVGVHTPEFEFEKDINNVRKAVNDNGIVYPVVLDNTYQTWRAYKNNYWPRKYLIDHTGVIRYDHIGEGAYEETELQIQKLLMERNASIALGEPVAGGIDAQSPSFGLKTPELYLGYEFARAALLNPESFRPGNTVEYSFSDFLLPDRVMLEGKWHNLPEAMRLDSDRGKVKLLYTARDLNIVAGSSARIVVTIDGKPIERSIAGADVMFENDQSVVYTEEERLYNLIKGTDIQSHIILLGVEGKGFELYTFTFG